MDYVTILIAVISLVTALIQLATAILTYKAYKNSQRNNEQDSG